MATFYIEALEATTITLSKVGNPILYAMYGINDTSVPNSYTYGSNITLSAGQKCYWTITSTTTAFTTTKYLKFTSTGRINVGGNLSDLIGGQTAIPRNNCFYRLFYQCDKLVDASNLVMVNNFNSKRNCYDSMFYNCTSLTTAPELPATTLTEACYSGMFRGCTSLTTAPQLPATTLAYNCYYNMFYDCISLTSAPELPATTLATYCYQYMFSGCTSLTSAPELPATTLADYCYQYMFRSCTSLTSAPELPATTLAYYCYYSMFSGCTNIKLSTTQTGNYQIPYRIPSSGTGTIGTHSLTDMFFLTSGTFTGTPTINTTYYLSKTSINIQLKDNDLKLYPKTTLHNIKDFPTQSNNAGKFLTTDGSKASWSELNTNAIIDVDELPETDIKNNIIYRIIDSKEEYNYYIYKDEWQRLSTGLDVKENIKRVIPNSGTGEEIYFDITMPNEEVKSLLESIHNDEEYIDICYSEPTYTDLWIDYDNDYPLIKFNEEVLYSYNEGGWDPEFNGIITSFVGLELSDNYEGYPVGIHNEELVDLCWYRNDTTKFTVNDSEGNKYTLNTGIEVIEEKGKHAIPNSGTGEEIYFDISMSNEEVKSLLESVHNGEEYIDICYSDNIVDLYVSYGTGDISIRLYYLSSGEEELYLYDYSEGGWNSDFNGVITDFVGLELSDEYDEDPVGLHNEELIDLCWCGNGSTKFTVNDSDGNKYTLVTKENLPDVVDQSYNAESTNAQSGTAVAQAIENSTIKWLDFICDPSEQEDNILKVHQAYESTQYGRGITLN